VARVDRAVEQAALAGKRFLAGILYQFLPNSIFSAPVMDLGREEAAWAFVPESAFGSGCDRIGVTSEAFAAQPDRCGVPYGTCLGAQTSHWVHNDSAQPPANLWNPAQILGVTLEAPEGSHGRNATAMLITYRPDTRFPVRVSLPLPPLADALSTPRVLWAAPGANITAHLEGAGVTATTVTTVTAFLRNTGTGAGDVTVTCDCRRGAAVAMSSLILAEAPASVIDAASGSPAEADAAAAAVAAATVTATAEPGASNTLGALALGSAIGAGHWLIATAQLALVGDATHPVRCSFNATLRDTLPLQQVANTTVVLAVPAFWVAVGHGTAAPNARAGQPPGLEVFFFFFFFF
jgi:hypothetical protein